MLHVANPSLSRWLITTRASILFRVESPAHDKVEEIPAVLVLPLFSLALESRRELDELIKAYHMVAIVVEVDTGQLDNLVARQLNVQL